MDALAAAKADYDEAAAYVRVARAQAAGVADELLWQRYWDALDKLKAAEDRFAYEILKERNNRREIEMGD